MDFCIVKEVAQILFLVSYFLYKDLHNCNLCFHLIVNINIQLCSILVHLLHLPDLCCSELTLIQMESMIFTNFALCYKRFIKCQKTKVTKCKLFVSFAFNLTHFLLFVHLFFSSKRKKGEDFINHITLQFWCSYFH